MHQDSRSGSFLKRRLNYLTDFDEVTLPILVLTSSFKFGKDPDVVKLVVLVRFGQREKCCSFALELIWILIMDPDKFQT